MKSTDRKSSATKNADRLIFTTKVFSESKNIRVGIDRASAAIVNDICLQTGLTASEVVNKMIAFCAPKVEIIPGFYYAEKGDDQDG